VTLEYKEHRLGWAPVAGAEAARAPATAKTLWLDPVKFEAIPLAPLDLARGTAFVLGDGPRHGSEVNDVQFAADGARLASSDRDGHVIVWDATTGKSIGWTPASTRPLFVAIAGDAVAIRAPEQLGDVMLAEDGRWLATASVPGGVHVIEIASGRRALAALDRPDAFVVAGDTLAAITADKSVVAGPLAGPYTVIAPATHEVYQIRLSPDGKRLATLGKDGVLRIRPLPSGEILEVRREALVDEHVTVPAMVWSPDGVSLALSIAGQYIAIVDTADGKQRALVHAAFGDWFDRLAFSPDGKRIAAGTKYGRVRVFDVATGAPVHRHVGQIGTVWSLATSRDGATIASAGDELALVWKPDPAATPAAYGDNEHWVTHVALLADGTRLASCSDYGDINVRELPGGALLEKLHTQHLECEGLAFMDRAHLIAATGNEAEVFELGAQHASRAFALAAARKYGSVTVAVSADGALLASAGDDGKIAMHRAADGARRWVVELPPNEHEPGERHVAASLAFDSSGALLAAVSDDNILRVYRAASGRVERTIKLGDDILRPTAVTFAGTRVAVGTSDGYVRVYDGAGRLVLDVRHVLGGVYSLAATPSRVLAGGDDGSISAWDLR
jgi:WD40 repeat protein